MDNPTREIFAMEIYFHADNIIAAGQMLMDTLGGIGVFSENVTTLIELDHA